MCTVITTSSAIDQGVLNGNLPQLKDVRAMLRWNPYVSCREKVLEAYIIGSTAKGTDTNDSDIDIAVIIPRKARKSALKFSEHYHAKFTCNSQKDTWDTKLVDFQFFYPDSEELKEYPRIKI